MEDAATPGGRTFGGRYDLVSLIATGGMGQVWRARDTRLHRDVAVKVLRSEYTGDPDFLARFRAEAQHTARLLHPNIATLFDYGEALPGAGGTDEHLAYLVMELVEGESLAALLARERRLSPARTLDVLEQAAAGLAAAHALGVVHRDVKPGNLLVARTGQVKVTDFGASWSAASVPLTQAGEVIGTAHYLAPEQALGARISPAGDVYSLGLVAYECLAGRRAFTGGSAVQIALSQIHDTPAPLPDDVPPEVRRLVERAITKDPAQRFADGAVLRAAVEDTRAGRAFPAAPPPAAPLPDAALPDTGLLPAGYLPDRTASPRSPRRRRQLVALLAALTLAGTVAGIVRAAGPDAPAEAATAPAAPTSTSAAPPAPRLLVASGPYVGRPVPEVAAELSAFGLVVTLRPLTTTDVPDGTVIAVDPLGELTPGSAVTLTHAVAPPAPVVPPAAPERTATGTAGGPTAAQQRTAVPGTAEPGSPEPSAPEPSGTDQGGTDQDGTDQGGDTPGNGNGKANGKGNGGGNGNGNGRGNR